MSYIKFTERSYITNKTKRWIVESSVQEGMELGEIRWYNPFHRYVFQPNFTTLYDYDCLKEVCSFLAQAMIEYNQEKAKRNDG